MENIGWFIGYDKETKILNMKLKDDLNFERLNTYYNDDLSKVIGLLDIPDPRKPSKAQRRFYWAMLGDMEYCLGGLDEDYDEYFKRRFFYKYDRKVSVSDDTKSSMEDVTNLINMVIDRILDEPMMQLSESFKYIGMNDYWFYASLMKKKCCLCGAKGEKAHVQAVGMGRNRKTIDHTKHAFMSLCNNHHREQHEKGITEFLKEHVVIPVWLVNDDLKSIGLPVINHDKTEFNVS